MQSPGREAVIDAGVEGDAAERALDVLIHGVFHADPSSLGKLGWSSSCMTAHHSAVWAACAAVAEILSGHDKTPQQSGSTTRYIVTNPQQSLRLSLVRDSLKANSSSRPQLCRPARWAGCHLAIRRTLLAAVKHDRSTRDAPHLPSLHNLKPTALDR